jgi:ketosteroid isomerase-like protein
MTDTPSLSPTDVVAMYFKRMDLGGDVYELFADDAYFWFPKLGEARGLPAIRELTAKMFPLWKSVDHVIPYLNYVAEGPMVVAEGRTRGELASGFTWTEDDALGRGRFCNVFEIRGGKIRRLHIYQDPDYAGEDTARYPWNND